MRDRSRMSLIRRSSVCPLRVDDLQVLALIGGQRSRDAVAQQLRQREHGVERRADLVAHVGDELALEPVGVHRRSRQTVRDAVQAESRPAASPASPRRAPRRRPPPRHAASQPTALDPTMRRRPQASPPTATGPQPGNRRADGGAPTPHRAPQRNHLCPRRSRSMRPFGALLRLSSDRAIAHARWPPPHSRPGAEPQPHPYRGWSRSWSPRRRSRRAGACRRPRRAPRAAAGGGTRSPSPACGPASPAGWPAAPHPRTGRCT